MCKQALPFGNLPKGRGGDGSLQIKKLSLKFLIKTRTFLSVEFLDIFANVQSKKTHCRFWQGVGGGGGLFPYQKNYYRDIIGIILGQKLQEKSAISSFQK